MEMQVQPIQYNSYIPYKEDKDVKVKEVQPSNKSDFAQDNSQRPFSQEAEYEKQKTLNDYLKERNLKGPDNSEKVNFYKDLIEKLEDVKEKYELKDTTLNNNLEKKELNKNEARIEVKDFLNEELSTMNEVLAKKEQLSSLISTYKSLSSEELSNDNNIKKIELESEIENISTEVNIKPELNNEEYSAKLNQEIEKTKDNIKEINKFINEVHTNLEANSLKENSINTYINTAKMNHENQTNLIFSSHNIISLLIALR